MKIMIEVAALGRVGEVMNPLLEILRRVPALAPVSFSCPWDDEENAPDDEPIPRVALQAADIRSMSAQDRGMFTIITAKGNILVAWAYLRQAWFAGSLHAKLVVLPAELPAIADAVSEVSEIVDAGYGMIDDYQLRAADIKNRARGESDPFDYLIDLYWYNYFGPRLTQVVRDVHGLTLDLPGVSTRQLVKGWEVRMDGLPAARPHPPHIEQYLLAAKMFRRYSPKGRFRCGQVRYR